MKNETVKIVSLQRFNKTNVHQNSSIEMLLAGLLNDKEAIVKLLPLKDWMKVVEKCLHVRSSISVIG